MIEGSAFNTPDLTVGNISSLIEWQSDGIHLINLLSIRKTTLNLKKKSQTLIILLSSEAHLLEINSRVPDFMMYSLYLVSHGVFLFN